MNWWQSLKLLSFHKKNPAKLMIMKGTFESFSIFYVLGLIDPLSDWLQNALEIMKIGPRLP